MSSTDEKGKRRGGYRCLLKQHRPIIRGEVFQAGQEAKVVIAAASKEAEQIVEEAQNRAGGLLDEERTRARELAKSQAAQEVARAMSWGEKYVESLRGAMVDAVLAVAKRVWGDLEVEHSDAVARVARQIRDEIGANQPARFRVHPEDREMLENIGLEVVSDPALMPGDCVAEVGGLVHDARASVRASLALEDLALSLGRKDLGGQDEW